MKVVRRVSQLLNKFREESEEYAVEYENDEAGVALSIAQRVQSRADCFRRVWSQEYRKKVSCGSHSSAEPAGEKGGHIQIGPLGLQATSRARISACSSGEGSMGGGPG